MTWWGLEVSFSRSRASKKAMFYRGRRLSTIRRDTLARDAHIIRSQGKMTHFVNISKRGTRCIHHHAKVITLSCIAKNPLLPNRAILSTRPKTKISDLEPLPIVALSVRVSGTSIHCFPTILLEICGSKGSHQKVMHTEFTHVVRAPSWCKESYFNHWKGTMALCYWIMDGDIVFNSVACCRDFSLRLVRPT